MKYFVEKGVPAAFLDTLNQSALFYASREGQLKCAEFLLKNGKVFFIQSITCRVRSES